MKKFLTLLLVCVLMVCTLASCSGKRFDYNYDEYLTLGNYKGLTAEEKVAPLTDEDFEYWDAEYIKQYVDPMHMRPMFEERRWGTYRVLDDARYADGSVNYHCGTYLYKAKNAGD